MAPKEKNRTGCGAVFYKKTLKKCRLKEASIFSAKICAINLALKLDSTSNKEKFIIHSDAISVLQSLKNTKFDNPFIVKLLNKLNSMNDSKKVIFYRIPRHIGILGNDKADSLTALNMIHDKKKSKIPYNDLKPKVRQIITKKWQQLWEKTSHNKLFQVQSLLKERMLDPYNTRKEETTLARLSIGHARLTHSFILKDQPSPKYQCGNQYTIKHILIECTKLTNIRRRFYNIDNMRELFRKIDP